MKSADTTQDEQIVVRSNEKKMIIIKSIRATKLDLHLTAEPGSTVDIITLAAIDSPWIDVTQNGTIAENATVHWWNITLPYHTINWNLESRVTGFGGKSTINWLFYGNKKDKYKLSAKNIFQEKNGRGEIHIKGVVENNAHASVNGMIEIGEHGNKTEAYLTEEILMLDASAKVDAVPKLEIRTDDVRASHSATVTKVNAEDLFYMASRGVSGEEARKMYVEGFLGSLMEAMQDEKHHLHIIKTVQKKCLL